MPITESQITQALADKGRLIEAGWLTLRDMAMPKDTPFAQLEQLREFFFGGAHHMLTSVKSMMGDGEEPTEQDYQRLTSVETELAEFIKGYMAKIKTEGRA